MLPANSAYVTFMYFTVLLKVKKSAFYIINYSILSVTLTTTPTTKQSNRRWQTSSPIPPSGELDKTTLCFILPHLLYYAKSWCVIHKTEK